jgi:hypothetical protein
VRYNKRKINQTANMRVFHQKLHLQHHRHTGKLIHHRHTSYRGLLVVVVLAASCMAGMAMVQRAAANELISISGTDPVPAPPAAALISTPADGTTITSSGTLVSGSCPIVTPQAVIVIGVDGTPIGSAVCDSNNDFSLPLVVSGGSHTITATPYSITAAVGPVSDAVHFAYQPTATARQSPPIDASLTPEIRFDTLGGDAALSWFGKLGGSQASYRLVVGWGDGNESAYTVQPGDLHVDHQYAKVGAYNTIFTLSDASGRVARQQYAVAAYGSFVPASSLAANTGLQRRETSTTIGLYGLFVTVISIAALLRLHAEPFAYADIKLPHHLGK